MIVISGLGALPGLTTTSPKCSVVDSNGICVSSLNVMQPRVQGPTGGGGVVSSWASKITGRLTMLPQPAPPQPPSTGWFPIGPAGSPATSGRPDQTIMDPASPEAPAQQPPPPGLPSQPELQPGTTVTSQEPSYAEIPFYRRPGLGKIALIVGGIALAGATVATVVSRRKKA